MSTLIEQLGNPATKRKKFLDSYQYILSIVATFLFFSDLPDYLWAAPLLPIYPLAWLSVLFFLSLPFIKNIRNLPKPLLIWMGIYTGISLLSLLTVSGDDISFTDFRAKVLSCLFIVVMHAIYQQKSLKHVRYVIILVVLITVFNNLVELFNPRFFSENNIGRPAGFYIDPNKTGCALILGMILGIDVIKQQWRWIYTAIVAVGVLATFSRGAIIGWVICMAIFISAKVLSKRRITAIVPLVAMLFFLVSLNPLQALTDYFKGDPANWDIVNRLEEFQNPSLKEDSATERQLVAAGGWMMFSNHPFWGNGLASTRKWSVSEVSTHNMYLYFMADNGIIGVIFLPGAILGVVYGNRGLQKQYLIAFAIFVSLWGLFSHEVLAERYTLTSFALVAAMNTNQKWYLKYANKNSDLTLAPPLASTKLRLPTPSNRKSLPHDRS